MKFWKALRWISSIAFLALIAAVWLSIGSSNDSGGGVPHLPAAPIIVR